MNDESGNENVNGEGENENAWNGDERRYGGRVVYSQGPIVRTLEILNGLSAIASIIALIVALVVFSGRLDLIQQSREASATDTCFLFRAVVLKAGGEKGQLLKSEAFLDQLGLGNCFHYGGAVTKLNESGN